MNFSVYLPQKIANKLSLLAQQHHTSKNAIIREALEEWFTHHYPKSQWSSHFFDFAPIEDVPDFSSYRNELAPPKEDIF